MSKSEVEAALYPRRSKSAGSEAAIQAAVLDWLNTIPGMRCWRQNTGAVALEHKGKRRLVRFGVPGQTDITGVFAPNGVLVAIEVKRPGNKPTFHQNAFIGQLREAGAVAFWCDSLASCCQQLRFEFKRRGWGWSEDWNVD